MENTRDSIFEKNFLKAGVVVYICHHKIGKSEVKGWTAISSRLAWDIEWVSGQPVLARMKPHLKK